MAAHPDATGTFTDGVKADGQGDVMAAFSSRGPGGQFLKPDITAPGVQILAGNTPVPDEVAGGPPGQYFQAIAGTSMSSPHIAGSAHPDEGAAPRLDAGRDQVGADDNGHHRCRQGRPRHPGRPVRLRRRSRRPDARPATRPIVFEDTADNMVDLGQRRCNGARRQPAVDQRSDDARHRHRDAYGDQRHRQATTSSMCRPRRRQGSKIKVSPDSGKIRPGRARPSR